MLKEAPHLFDEFGDQIKPSAMNVQAGFIDVILQTGFNRNRLKALLFEMVSISEKHILSTKS